MRKPVKKSPIKKPVSKSVKKTAVKFAASIEEKHIHDVLEESILEYSSYSIEDRAVPSYQDGLKPSQRRLLWTLYYAMGSRPDKNYIKSARVTGQAMTYHPHGDSYLTLVNMVEGISTPLVIGMGNWGSYSAFTPAAASRYSECKLSAFTMAMYFDPRFKNAYNRVPNFDGSSEEPVFLPAQLPMALTLDQSGIAVGVTCDLPSFTVASLFKAVQIALKSPNYKVHPKKLARILELTCAYGGVSKETEANMLELMKTGVASINWSCAYQIKNDEIHITGLPPGKWSFDNKMSKIREIKDVAEVADLSSNDDILIRVTFRRVSSEQKEAAQRKVIQLLQSKTHFKTNVVERYYQEDDLVDFSRAKFMSVSIVELLARWTENRIEIEKRALQDEIEDLNKVLAYQQLMRKAVDHLDTIFKILKTKGIDKVAVLSKQLKITTEESQIIWQIAVGRLDRLSSDQINAKIKELQTSLSIAKKRLKAPADSVLQHMNENKKALLSPIAYEWA